jgi:hypothetical protein
MSPTFTIVIPTVNREELLRRAVASALNQTVPTRVLVSDNGSTDGTQAFLASLEHPLLTKKRIEPTISAQSHGRRLQEWLETEWAVFLSDDDCLDINFMAAIQATLAEHPTAVIVYSRAMVHMWDVAYPGAAGPGEEEGWEFFQAFLEGKREPTWCAMALRRQDLLDAGPQPEERIIGDMFFWIRIAAKGTVACCPRPLSHYWYLHAALDNVTSGTPLRTWARECRVQAAEMEERILRNGQGRAMPLGQLRRLERGFIARSCANQVLWNAIRGRSRWALVQDVVRCLPLFLAWPSVWARVIGGCVLPKRLIRWRVEAVVRKKAGRPVPAP